MASLDHNDEAIFIQKLYLHILSESSLCNDKIIALLIEVDISEINQKLGQVAITAWLWDNGQCICMLLKSVSHLDG